MFVHMSSSGQASLPTRPKSAKFIARLRMELLSFMSSHVYVVWVKFNHPLSSFFLSFFSPSGDLKKEKKKMDAPLLSISLL